MTQRGMHRSEQAEHPFVIEAKKWAKQAGAPEDNGLINWAVRAQEDALAFGNRPRISNL